MHRRLHCIILCFIYFLLLLACNPSNNPSIPRPTEIIPATSTPTLVLTATLTSPPTTTPTSTMTSTSTRTPTKIASPTQSLTPTTTSTLTITPTPTYSLPTITVLMQANCRYGPAKAYLYAWGMYPGDTGTVWGRNYSGTWLWIQPDNIEYQCWIASSTVEIQGDVSILRVGPVRLPHSVLYGPPDNVTAVRDGNSVTVSWQKVNMTEDDDRGYMIEANVCQNGNLIWMAVATMDNFYAFTDETTCSQDSNGLLYTVEKHGYTNPVPIPWP